MESNTVAQTKGEGPLRRSAYSTSAAGISDLLTVLHAMLSSYLPRPLSPALSHRCGGITWPVDTLILTDLGSALIRAPPTLGSMLIAHHPRECTQACTTRIRECAYPHATLGVRLSACHPRSGA